MNKMMAISLLMISFNLIGSQSCSVGPNGINLWQLVYEVGACVDSMHDSLTSTMEQCCSALGSFDATLLKSDIDSVSTKVDSTSSKVDYWGNNLSQQDVLIKSDIDALATALGNCCSSLSSATFIGLLKSDIDSVSTKVDSVSSKVDYW